MSETVNRTEIRKTVRDVIQASDSPGVPWEDVVGIASTQQGVTPEDVTRELEALEKEGFVYVVGENRVVKLP